MKADYFYPYTQTTGIEIARNLAALVRLSKPKITTPALQKEVKLLVKLICDNAGTLNIELSSRGLDLNIDFDLAAPKHEKDIKRMKKLAKELQALIYKNWKIDTLSLGLNDKLYELEQAYVGAGYVSEMLDKKPHYVTKKKPTGKKAGAPEKEAEKDFIEFAAQIFERASGLKLNKYFGSLSNADRLVVGKFYKYLALITPAEMKYKEEDSQNRFVRAYFKDGRKSQGRVAEKIRKISQKLK